MNNGLSWIEGKLESELDVVLAHSLSASSSKLKSYEKKPNLVDRCHVF